MAVPFKNGADLYNNEVLRMRLHNLGADPTEVGAGLIYFNTSDGLNTSKRARIYDGTTFRSLAFLDEVANNEAFNALVGRIDEAEGDITSLEGRATSLEGRATATEGNLSTLKARVDAFLDGGVDSDAVLENLKEIQAFLDAYDGATSLAEMFDAVNTQIADRYTKAEADGRFLKLTGGKVVGDTIIEGTTTVRRSARFPLYVETVDTTADGVGIRFRNNGTNTIGLYTKFSDDQLYRYNRALTELYTILDTGNYSDLITTLNRSLSVGGNVTLGKDKCLQLTNTSDKVVDALRIHTNNILYVGYGSYQEKQDTWLWGKNIKFIYGEQGMSAMTIDENGNIHISKNLIVDGEVSAGGAGEEGSDDMGLALLENWADYDATKAQALGAVLGKDMYDRVVTLEGKSTNVQFTPTLSSGKQIGAITIDGVATGIFAPDKLSQFTDDVVAGNYLPLSGGTMGGILTMNHVNASDKASYIIFKDSRINSNTQFADYIFRVSDFNDSFRGGFGLKGDANEIDYYFLGKNGSTSENNLRLYSDRAAWGSSTILHSGNVGEYAALKDGSNASGNWGIDISGSAAKLGGIEPSRFMITSAKDIGETDFNQNLLSTNQPAIIRLGPVALHPNIPNPNLGYGYVLHVGHADKDTAWELVAGYASNTPLMFRTGTWKADGTGTINSNGWKTIAFTDSNITGNAATATKLKTAVNLWGNSFDGTANITGNLHLNNSKVIASKMTDGTSVTLLTLNDAENLLIGQGSGEQGCDTYLYGRSINFKTRESLNIAMTITEEGNVLVGTTTGEDVKFTVNGSTSINLGYHRINSAEGVPTKASEINPQTTFSLIHGYDRRYGLHAWLASNASVSLQSSYANQTSDTCYALNLNPLGGAVNIGSTSGNGLLTTYGGIKLAGGTNYQKIQSEGTMVIGVESGRIDLSAPTEINFITRASNILFNGTALGPWTQYDNAISLGQSNARWSNVYSVNGDFKGRVLIEGAADDTISALNVKGSTRVEDIVTSKSGTEWASGYYSIDSSRNRLGGFGFHVKDNALVEAFIGASFQRTWFTINSNESNFKVPVNFMAGVSIPTSQTFKIGEATLSWDADKNALKVDKNIYSDGEVSAGGAGEEGETESTGNASAWAQTFVPTNTTMPFEHNRATTDVIVQVYEKNDGGSWDMILVDVEIISETKVNLHFGRTENREHKIVIMG